MSPFMPAAAGTRLLGAVKNAQEVRRGHTTRPGHDEPVLIFAQDVAGTNPEGSGGMTRLSESTQQRQ